MRAQVKAVLQRVSQASVTVDGQQVGAIKSGWLVLLGVAGDDSQKEAGYISDKILGLRCFADTEGKMNLSVKDIGGELLVISQFTLYGDCRKGRRPSFSRAADGEWARDLYELVISNLEDSGLKVQRGRFGADMKVSLINDGPVTMIIESPC